MNVGQVIEIGRDGGIEVTTNQREFGLRVQMVAGSTSLHRLLSALHRKRVTIKSVSYEADAGMAVMTLAAPSANVVHIVATLSREPTIGRVEMVADLPASSTPLVSASPR